MGLVLNHNLIFTNFCGPRWLWSPFGTNFCDFLHKRMVINNEANPIFLTFLLVTSQHKMWSSFSDVFFFKLSFFFLFLQQTGASIGSNFFQTLLWISSGWWKIYLFITIKDWWNTLSTVMWHHRWHMLCFAFQYRLCVDCLDYFDWFRLFQMYAWPLLQTLLSEVLTKDEWLRAWDNIFSNHPSFLLFVVVAYVIVSRKALLQCTRKEDFEVWNGLKILKRKCFRHDFLASMMAWN